MDFAKKIDDSTVLLEFDKSIYDSQTLVSAAYKFTDKCVIYCNPVSDRINGVFIKLKDGAD